MKILAIDTSNQPLSVAILEDQKLLAQTTLTVGKNHSVTLMPVIAALLKQSQLKPKDLTRIVVAQGPGSYTGLRIGVTAAKTLAFSLGIELVGVSSLALLAANYAVDMTNSPLLVPIFDARRENVFAGAYRWQDGNLVTVLADQHISMADLCTQLVGENPCFIGIDAHRLQDLIAQSCSTPFKLAPEQFCYPQAYQLGLLGLTKQPSEIQTFVPAYLRLTQAELQWLEKNPEGTKTDGKYVEKI